MPRIEPSYGRALVTGVGGPSGRAAVAALKAKGYSVIGVDMRDVPHEADAFFEVPPAHDPGYLAALAGLLAREGVRWLVPTVSEELFLVAEAAPGLRRGGVAVYLGEPRAVRICNDKWETAGALRKAGVAAPRSAIGEAGSPEVRALGFPVVSRPRVGRGGRGVVVHDRPGTPPQAERPIWQEFLPGTEYDVMMVAHPDPPHEIVAAEVFEKTVLKDGRVGNALEVARVEAPDVSRLAREAAAALGLWGPMDIDLRRGADGKPRVLEINARIGAHTPKAPAIFDALSSLFEQGHRG
jgi:carbamoylphosphate synthase large subunit